MVAADGIAGPTATAAPGARGTLSAAARIRRARRISSTFGRVYLGIKANQWVAKHLAPPDMTRRWSRFHRQSASSIYSAAVELRGLILKGCQFLGARADVLPPEYVAALASLQDRVPPRSLSSIRRVVESELGQPLEAMFASFSRAPVASASLAQVHEARLWSGERVAVKVQYPEIASLVRSDLANLRVLFRAVGIVERDLELMPLFEELEAHMPLELDFEAEGRSAESFAAYFADRDDVHVPRVHWDFSARRVLVMDFIDGIKISDTAALRAAGVDTDALMRTLIEVYCEQILVRGHFHADPHPGNLLVQARAGAPRLVLLDFGLTKRLPPDFRRGVVAFAAALLGGQPEAMAGALCELGFETRDGGRDSLAAIARILLDVATQLRQQSFVDPAVLREASEALPRLVRENPIVRVPSHVILLGRVLGLLSGLGRTLDARVDMLQTIWPYAAGPTAAASAPEAQPGT